jgi:hypothetical protein
MSFVPPCYSAESAQSIPSYSSEPLAGERRLEHSPPVAHRPIPTGIFTKDNGRVSLLLTQQEDGAALPTYGRNSIIRGVVFPKDTEDVFAVTVKVVKGFILFHCLLLTASQVNGLLDLTVAEGATSYTPLVAKQITVWHHNSSDQTTCPDALPFEYQLPTTYKAFERVHPLPPSFNYSSSGVPGLFAKCIYMLTVEITRNSFWKRHIQ